TRRQARITPPGEQESAYRHPPPERVAPGDLLPHADLQPVAHSTCAVGESSPIGGKGYVDGLHARPHGVPSPSGGWRGQHPGLPVPFLDPGVRATAPPGAPARAEIGRGPLRPIAALLSPGQSSDGVIAPSVSPQLPNSAPG